MNQPAKAPFSAPTNIGEVLANLEYIIQDSLKDKNHLCLFAFVYLETTRAIKNAIETGRFENPDRMEKMDVIFANLYINAFQHYTEHQNVPQSWKFAFDSKNDQLAIIQHILLGMNAHINLDLSVAAATIAKGPEIMNLKNDFMTVNKILEELTNTMQKGLGKVSIFMKLLDFLGFRSDERIINFSIKKARDFAWINAVELALLEKEYQQERIEDIDIKVLELSKIIKHPPGRLLNKTLRLIAVFEEKDTAKLIAKMRNDSKSN